MIDRGELLTLYRKLEDMEKQMLDAREDSNHWKAENELLAHAASVHADENRKLRESKAKLRDALNKAGGPEPLVGYAFDANHQHESLINEMALRRKVCLEALAADDEMENR
jgi:hypothetical protein